MYIIAGLGNPTRAYIGTRHNIGFAVIDAIADKFNISVEHKQHKALIGKGMAAGEKVILAKPQTYMNLSGESIREICNYYKVTEDKIIVIFDDISLDVGQIRIKKKGSAGGHNGIKSIIENLGTMDFPRVKIGVGNKPPKMDLADYVLGHFAKGELEKIDESIEKAVQAVEIMLSESNEAAMNKFN